jgi:hypothetical protein
MTARPAAVLDTLFREGLLPRVVGERRVLYSHPPDGHVAEWLRNGLQNRVPRFNSGRGLQSNLFTGRAFVPWFRASAKIGERAPECLAIRSGFCYRPFVITNVAPFPGSSVVEQPAVNRLVAGSNPARGAKFFQLVRRTPGYRFLGMGTLGVSICEFA